MLSWSKDHITDTQVQRRWVLSFMWLKFTVIWRFFRLAALAAGMDAPENIRRCFANNYDIEASLQQMAVEAQTVLADC